MGKWMESQRTTGFEEEKEKEIERGTAESVRMSGASGWKKLKLAIKFSLPFLPLFVFVLMINWLEGPFPNYEQSP